jgi:hypothetical protein
MDSGHRQPVVLVRVSTWHKTLPLHWYTHAPKGRIFEQQATSPKDKNFDPLAISLPQNAKMDNARLL